MQEIQRADPQARRRARMLVVCGTPSGLILILLAGMYRPAFAEWVARDLESRSTLICVALALAFVLPMLALAAYFWRLGDRVVRAERFPAPGTAVVTDTVVLHGDSARRRGRLAQVVAAFLVVMSAGFCVLLWRFLFLFKSTT